MSAIGSVVAVFTAHQAAETAVNRLSAAGFQMKNLSVIGRGSQSAETAIGFYSIAERDHFWGARGTFWGTLWGRFVGGAFLTTPLLGPVVILGRLAPIAVASLENADFIAELSIVGAALYTIGISKESALDYEEAVKLDRVLVIAHGPATSMIDAKILLGKLAPSRLDMHANGKRADLIPQFA